MVETLEPLIRPFNEIGYIVIKTISDLIIHFMFCLSGHIRMHIAQSISDGPDRLHNGQDNFITTNLHTLKNTTYDANK